MGRQAVVLYYGENPYMGRVEQEEIIAPLEKIKMVCWCVPKDPKEDSKEDSKYVWLVPPALQHENEEEWKRRGVVKVSKDTRSFI